MANANLFTLRRNNSTGKLELLEGIRIELLDVDGGLQRSLIIGSRGAKNPRQKMIVPVDFRNQPEFGRGGDLAFRGSFVMAGGENPIPQLAKFSEEDGTCYLFARLGLDPNYPLMKEVDRLQQAWTAGGRDGHVQFTKRYGSVSLHSGAGSDKIVSHEGGDPDGVEAQEVYRKVGFRPGLGFPPHVHVVWRHVPRSGSLNLDITGELAAVANDKGVLRLGDGSNLRGLFDARLTEQLGH